MADVADLFNPDGLNIQNASMPVQMVLALGLSTLLPAALMTMTCFTRVVIVLSFVRQGLGTQQVPPNLVIIGLALFLSLFIMRPTIEKMDATALTPYLNKQITGPEALKNAETAIKEFMLRHTRKADLGLFLMMSNNKAVEKEMDTPLFTLLPAFVISELKTAFIMGFCIYLPFLMVDLVVSSVLTSMGMVMMPPVTISAPFKILLFVLADGWHLVSHALAASYL